MEKKFSLADLSSEGRELHAKAKRSAEFVGIDASHLSPEDRRMLATMGISFTENRERRIIATYSQSSRQADLRAAIIAKQNLKQSKP